jgi:hypothetical protein
MKSIKHGIELNGVANITLLVGSLTETLSKPSKNGWDEVALSTTIHSIEEQLKLLERYMITHNKAMNEGEIPPAWHEILANPTLFPDNSGK